MVGCCRRRSRALMGDLGYRALSTVAGGGVTFGHWVNQMYMKGYVLMVYSDYLKKMVE
uniref:Uncharacterized protein n=1 Tax=Helianthus annuus TaxID=4232 RepID=A0A251VAG7_HELAN